MMTSYGGGAGGEGSRRAGFGCGMLVLIFCCHLLGVCVCVCVCAFGVRPMFLGFYGVCSRWFFGNNRLNFITN